ncbi:MAG: right-handed parallel beta-helix repeat-containing protein [Planctomycetota bacterium]
MDGVTQLTVRNGVLGGGSSGIESRAGNTTVEDVSFIGGSGVGARLFPNAVVRRSTFRDYFGGGLIVVRASDDPFSTVIEDCTFTRIGPTGSTAIAASDLTTIRNVTVEDCGSGISVGDNSSVTDVRIAQMLGRAVTMGNNCSLTGFTISRAVTAADSRDGVLGGDECLIKDGTFTNYLGTGSMMTLARNAHVSDTILRNATAAGANGLRVSTSSTILDCSIDDANNIGLAAGSYCTIRGNSIESRFFGGTAIQVDGRCLIDGNRTFGDIEYTGVENVIVRNSIESGDIVENGTPSTNTVGPLNDLTSPWANFRR